MLYAALKNAISWYAKFYQLIQKILSHIKLTQNGISCYTQCNQLIHNILSGDTQNVISWYTKCYQLIYKMISADTQNFIIWNNKMLLADTQKVDEIFEEIGCWADVCYYERGVKKRLHGKI
jgi:hypothetical protein